MSIKLNGKKRGKHEGNPGKANSLYQLVMSSPGNSLALGNCSYHCVFDEGIFPFFNKVHALEQVQMKVGSKWINTSTEEYFCGWGLEEGGKG